jgi:hypothetical protein
MQQYKGTINILQYYSTFYTSLLPIHCKVDAYIRFNSPSWLCRFLLFRAFGSPYKRVQLPQKIEGQYSPMALDATLFIV